jgi:hypothetical protein
MIFAMRQNANYNGLFPRRLRAKPELRQEIKRQGRHLGWLAQHLGVSTSFMSRVVAGERTIPEPAARLLVALIGGDLGMLFELPDGKERRVIGSSPVAKSREP